MRLLTTVSAAVILSCAPRFAAAADYSAAYAIQLPGMQAQGILENCAFGNICEAKIEGDKATLRVSLNKDGTGRVYLHTPARCCLFADGASAGKLTNQRGIQQLLVFVGRERRKNEYVRNEKIGDIYIAISR